MSVKSGLDPSKVLDEDKRCVKLKSAVSFAL